jgi:hypothetical protein
VSALIAVPKHGALGQGFTKRERFEGDHLYHGRRTDGTQSAATHITTLSDRRNVILLCGWCRPKFNPRANRYRPMYVPSLSDATDPYRYGGACDACKTQTAQTPGGGRSFVSEETYSQVCMEPVDTRRRSRAAWRTGSSIWAAVQSYTARAWGS